MGYQTTPSVVSESFLDTIKRKRKFFCYRQTEAKVERGEDRVKDVGANLRASSGNLRPIMGYQTTPCVVSESFLATIERKRKCFRYRQNEAGVEMEGRTELKTAGVNKHASCVAAFNISNKCRCVRDVS